MVAITKFAVAAAAFASIAAAAPSAYYPKSNCTDTSHDNSGKPPYAPGRPGRPGKPSGGKPYSAPTPIKTVVPDGFPTPNPEQLRKIEEAADGGLSNAPPPAKLAASSLTTFQAIKFNEDFESFYFRSLLKNITEGVKGFESYEQYGQSELASTVATILAQEELHSINARNVLNNFKAFVPEACEYRFPSSNIAEAVEFIQTHTSLVLGALQDASQTLANNQDSGAVRAVASVIGQEGEQNGFYRVLLGRKPSEKPFLTTAVGPFLFSWLQQFVVSCPFDIKQIPIPTFPLLRVDDASKGRDVEAKDQNLSFSADLAGNAKAASFKGGNGEGLFVTYFSGQLVPISEPVKNVKWDGDKVTFEAFFPFEKNIMFGLSVSSLTMAKDLKTPGDVLAATLAAPGLIQVNDLL